MPVATAAPTADLEHEDGSLPPAASAGRQTEGERHPHAERGPRPGVKELAGEVGRAIGTGSEFG